MKANRREFLTGMGGLAALAAMPRFGSEGLQADPGPSSSTLPVKRDFTIPEGVTYINSAYTHPIPKVGVEAARKYAELRSEPQAVSHQLSVNDVKAEFAALINAKPSEISSVTSTSAGENFVVNGLGIPQTKGNVVTDALHFEGALLHLGELQKRNGLDLRIVRPRDWRIDLKDLERAVDKNTKLIEISLVAMDNGFQYDLKAVCDLAHSHGAYVYADIAQAAGSTPIDVRESNVDFCACSSFKWLMGDFGLGFLYVREDLLDRVIKRTQYGYFQATEMQSHFLPGDPPAESPYTWKLGTDASGHFEVGTNSIGVMHILAASLPYIRKLGVENIQAYRQPILKRLHEEMPRLGFPPLTPPECKSALVSFEVKDYEAVQQRLRRANINARLGRHFIRLSPSVFNDMKDIETLLNALS